MFIPWSSHLYCFSVFPKYKCLLNIRWREVNCFNFDNCIIIDSFVIRRIYFSCYFKTGSIGFIRLSKAFMIQVKKS